MKTVYVTIEGISPLLMHRFSMEPIEAIDKKTPEEQAKLSAYIDEEKGNLLYVPATAVQRALVTGATYSKGKGRSSLQKNVAACVMVSPERISLGTRDYVIDSRPVVIPATKGRILRHRPRLDKWKISFQIDYDQNLITRDQLNRILVDTGQRVGLLEFRPEKKGPFGRFMISEFD